MSKNELKYIRVLIIIGLIISIVFFLSGSLTVYMKGFLRECDRIVVTDNNREKLVSLIEETLDALIKETEDALMSADYYKKMPDINRAKEIECWVKLHKDDITVFYEDGTTYSFYVRRSYGGPLISLIQNEGYNVYFRSSEFVADLIKVIIPLMAIVVAVILIRKINVILIRRKWREEIGISVNGNGN